jgi:hypothetical protein
MSATDRQRDEISKKAFWRQHIDDYERSPLSQNQYCSKNGLALSTFSYWKRKIGTKTKATPRFYPLTVQQLSSPTDQTSKSCLFLEVCDSRFRIELTENFSASCLKKLLLTLEQL